MIDLDNLSPDDTDREVAAGLAGPRHRTGGHRSRRSQTRWMARVTRGQRRRESVYLGYEDIGGDAGGA